MGKNYIPCLTRMNIHANLVPITVCDGVYQLVGSHCRNCEFWVGNQDTEEDEDETEEETDV